jgi:hypothetical protein
MGRWRRRCGLWVFQPDVASVDAMVALYRRSFVFQHAVGCCFGVHSWSIGHRVCVSKNDLFFFSRGDLLEISRDLPRIAGDLLEISSFPVDLHGDPQKKYFSDTFDTYLK